MVKRSPAVRQDNQTCKMVWIDKVDETNHIDQVDQTDPISRGHVKW